jgi:hypothetical protein
MNSKAMAEATLHTAVVVATLVLGKEARVPEADKDQLAAVPMLMRLDIPSPEGAGRRWSERE